MSTKKAKLLMTTEIVRSEDDKMRLRLANWLIKWKFFQRVAYILTGEKKAIVSLCRLLDLNLGPDEPVLPKPLRLWCETQIEGFNGYLYVEWS